MMYHRIYQGPNRRLPHQEWSMLRLMLNIGDDANKGASTGCGLSLVGCAASLTDNGGS